VAHAPCLSCNSSPSKHNLLDSLDIPLAVGMLRDIKLLHYNMLCPAISDMQWCHWCVICPPCRCSNNTASTAHGKAITGNIIATAADRDSTMHCPTSNTHTIVGHTDGPGFVPAIVRCGHELIAETFSRVLNPYD
jgi:hypothetical protein